MSKTLKQLAEEAIGIQNACNLTGVVHGFSRACTALRELYPNEGTAFFNTHPIVVLWADKIADLSYHGEPILASEAHACVAHMAAGGTDPEIVLPVPGPAECTQAHKGSESNRHIYDCTDCECPVHGDRNRAMFPEYERGEV